MEILSNRWFHLSWEISPLDTEQLGRRTKGAKVFSVPEFDNYSNALTTQWKQIQNMITEPYCT